MFVAIAMHVSVCVTVLSHTRILPIRIWAIPYAYGLPIRVWASFLDPYAYGLPVRLRAAHTSIVGNPCFAHMRISAHTCMHGHIASSLHAHAYSNACSYRQNRSRLRFHSCSMHALHEVIVIAI